MRPVSPVLIIIQGVPGAGKTTLARKLRQRLGIGVLSKDAIKELLFDTIGHPKDRERSADYGLAAVMGMFAISRVLLQKRVSHILESAYHLPLANDDIRQLLAGMKVKVIQIYCRIDDDVQQQRFNRRLEEGDRHPGHLDQVHTSLENFKRDSSFTDRALYGRLTIEDTIDIDLTHFNDTDLDKLIKDIQMRLNQ